MNNHSFLSFVSDVLHDNKATAISVFDVHALLGITDYMVIASARSNRQATAIAEHLIEQAKHYGQPPLGTEGLARGEWVLIDLVDIVVHIMIPEIRDMYNLEALFSHPTA